MTLLGLSASLTGWGTVARLAVAAGLGAAVGFERELREREAGIRTHLLVCLGAALFTIVGSYGFEQFGSQVDFSRVAAQIVTGIGFLGAGAIIREGISVRGLTTAGSLWVVAAIGMGVGVGYYWPAVAATALTIFALWPLRAFVSRTVERVRPAGRRLFVELEPGHPTQPLLGELGDVRFLQLEDEHDRRLVTVDLAREVDEALVARLADLDYVRGVRWQR